MVYSSFPNWDNKWNRREALILMAISSAHSWLFSGQRMSHWKRQEYPLWNVVHGACGCSHQTGFHFYLLTCFLIGRRSWTIIRGNLSRGLVTFLDISSLFSSSFSNLAAFFLSVPTALLMLTHPEWVPLANLEGCTRCRCSHRLSGHQDQLSEIYWHRCIGRPVLFLVLLNTSDVVSFLKFKSQFLSKSLNCLFFQFTMVLNYPCEKEDNGNTLVHLFCLCCSGATELAVGQSPEW